MWIFCAGSKRSGSTLQYNIVARIIEIKGMGKRLSHKKPEEFLALVEEHKNFEKMKVFKTHILTKEMKSFIESSPNAKIIYSYRDLRDVIVSLINKGWIKQSIKPISNFTETYIRDYEDWMTLKERMYISKYEMFYNNINDEVKLIGNYLGIDLDENEIVQIANELSVKSFDNNIVNFTKSDKYTFDKETLMHEGHIQGRKPKQFVNKLKEIEIIEIEKKAYDWLSKRGYELYWKNTKQFLSFSQHADDYIAWQLLDKKNKGLIVEVGAFDGQHLSNSLSLEQLGWKSICIEPSPKVFEYLQKNRPNAVNLNMAIVGDESIDEIDFYAEEIGVLSGCVIDEVDLKKRYKNRGLDYNKPDKIKVKASTLNQILSSQDCENIDVISIDVEGFELEVLNGLDLNAFNIKVLIIEANNFKTKNDILNYFNKYIDYMFIGDNYQNLFFVKKSYLSRKIIRNLDYKKHVKSKQIHPKGEIYTIQSISPNFIKSEALIKFEKYFGFF